MTVASAVDRNDYTGNGAASSYSYTFKIQEQDEIAVITRSTADVETTLTLTTDFTVSGVGVQTGGTVSLVNGPLASGVKITILRDLSIVQDTALAGQRQFFGSSIEAGIDRLAMINQMINEAINRCIKFPKTDDPDLDSELPVSSSRASSYLVFDSSGNVTTTPTPSSISGFTAGSILFAGSNGYPTQNNASLSWIDASKILRLGTLSGVEWTNTTSYGYFSLHNAQTTFNAVVDNTIHWAYNITSGTTSTRISTSEPSFKVSIEADYNDGVNRLMEFNHNYTSADGNVANSRRAFNLQIDRITHLMYWNFSGDRWSYFEALGVTEYLRMIPGGLALGAGCTALSSVSAPLTIRVSQSNSGVGGRAGEIRLQNTDTTTNINYTMLEHYSPSGGLAANIDFVNTTPGSHFAKIRFATRGAGGYASQMELHDTGFLGLNTAIPRRRGDFLDASNPQMRFTYSDNSVYTDFQTTSGGNLVITPTGSAITCGATTNTVDFGGSAALWRNFYFGTQAFAPNATLTAPAYSFSNFTSTGIYMVSSGTRLCFGVANTFLVQMGNAALSIASNASLAWHNSTTETSSRDLLVTRDNPGSLGIGGYGSGQKISISTLSELLTVASSATTDTIIQIPLNAVVFAVSVRVTTIIPTAATFTVTGASSGTQFDVASGVLVAANTTDVGTRNCTFKNSAAQAIRITPNLTPVNNTGRVRVTIHYYEITPATA